MDLIRERPYTLWAGLLGASLVIALAFYFILPPTQTERVLFFPQNITGITTGEARLLPREHGIEKQVRTLVEELLLGPERARDLRLVPVDTKAQSVIVRNDQVYIDFSPQMVTSSTNVHEPTEDAIKLIERTIRFNFPRIRRVTVTIAGQLPGQPYFSIK